MGQDVLCGLFQTAGVGQGLCAVLPSEAHVHQLQTQLAIRPIITLLHGMNA